MAHEEPAGRSTAAEQWDTAQRLRHPGIYPGIPSPLSAAERECIADEMEQRARETRARDTGE